MLVVAMANVATIYFHQAQRRHDAHVVNVAGRQRMLTQKISKLALLVDSGTFSKLNPELFQNPSQICPPVIESMIMSCFPRTLPL